MVAEVQQITLDLFQEQDIDKLALNYWSEFQNVSGSIINKSRYAQDVRAEREVKGIKKKASEHFAQWGQQGSSWFITALEECLVEVWMVLIHGEPSQNIHDKIKVAAQPKPTLMKMSQLWSMVPEGIDLPHCILLGRFHLHEDRAMANYQYAGQDVWYIRHFQNKDGRWKIVPHDVLIMTVIPKSGEHVLLRK